MIFRKRQAQRLSIQQRLGAKNRPQNAHALRSLVEWLISTRELIHKGEFHSERAEPPRRSVHPCFAAAFAGLDGGGCRTPLAGRELGSDRFRWLAHHDSTNRLQRKGVPRTELRPMTNGQPLASVALKGRDKCATNTPRTRETERRNDPNADVTREVADSFCPSKPANRGHSFTSGSQLFVITFRYRSCRAPSGRWILGGLATQGGASRLPPRRSALG